MGCEAATKKETKNITTKDTKNTKFRIKNYIEPFVSRISLTLTLSLREREG